jgi:hypothetical protein
MPKVIEFSQAEVDIVADKIADAINAMNLEAHQICAALHVILKDLSDQGIEMKLVDDGDPDQKDLH